MPVRLDRIYTKNGDKGTTRAIGGDEVTKSSLQIECYGTLDELNCHIGLVRSLIIQYKHIDEQLVTETERIFKVIQNDLFDLGCTLTPSSPKNEPNQCKNNKKTDLYKQTNFNNRTEFLEKRIDSYLKELKPLNSFLLPGGGVLNGHVHLARAVARRFERLLVRWNESNTVEPAILAYANRLSDFLFVFARWEAKKLGEEELLWEPNLA